MISLKSAKQDLDACTSLEQVRALKSGWFGKQGVLSTMLKALGSMSEEERHGFGKRLNLLKEDLLALILEKERFLEKKRWEDALALERIDVTLPMEKEETTLHPLHHLLAQSVEIFSGMGFSTRKGPDIETPWYNFDALNVGPQHPARAEQDTFYLGEYVLRTQTSPVQIRTLLTESPPLRIISPGRVYRSDHDRTHLPMFQQIEGLVVEPEVHMGHLKGCLEAFLRALLGEGVETRFRPSYFPFTQPSIEVDICFPDKPNSWLEVMGCGMIHPQVLKNVDLDPTIHQGFAFGMGIERLAMLKYNVEDIRHFYANDQRWLRTYGPYFTQSLL